MTVLARALCSIPALGLALFFVLGMVSLFSNPDFELSKMIDHLGSRELHWTVILSLGYGLQALLLSWLGAWVVLVLSRGRGTGLFRFFSVLPGMAYALAVLLVLRSFGAESLYSMRSVVIAWTLAGIPFLSAGISEGIRDLGPASKDALRTLGAGPIRAFFHHEFRGTLVLQASLLLQQFWFFMTSFSLVVILGGGPPAETLEVALYSAVRSGRMDHSRAMALAFAQSLILVLLRIALVWVRGLVHRERGVAEGYRRVPDRMGRAGTLMVAFVCGGISGLLGLRVSEWRDFLDPLFSSILLGVLVVAFTLVFSVSSYVSGWRALGALSTWCSPLLLSLSIWSLSGFTLPAVLNCALIQTLFFAPWFSQTLFPLLDRSQKFELEAARVFGAGRLRAFLEVEWPRLRGGVRRVLAMIFALSVTEVTSVMLFSRGDFDTLSSYSQNLFSRFRIAEAAFGVMILLFLSSLSLHFGEERA